MLITYHYWSHIGEASAIRQMLGHPDLPQWVGDLTGSRRTDARRTDRLAQPVRPRRPR